MAQSLSQKQFRFFQSVSTPPGPRVFRVCRHESRPGQTFPVASITEYGSLSGRRIRGPAPPSPSWHTTHEQQIRNTTNKTSLTTAIVFAKFSRFNISRDYFCLRAPFLFSEKNEGCWGINNQIKKYWSHTQSVIFKKKNPLDT